MLELKKLPSESKMKKTDQSALVTNEKWPFQIPCYPTMSEPGPSREGCGGGVKAVWTMSEVRLFFSHGSFPRLGRFYALISTHPTSSTDSLKMPIRTISCNVHVSVSSHLVVDYAQDKWLEF